MGRLCGKEHLTGDSHFAGIANRQAAKPQRPFFIVPTTSGWLPLQVIKTIVPLQDDGLDAKSTVGEATWIYSLRTPFRGGAGEYAGRDYQLPLRKLTSLR
ncbi:hypothetical protein MTO96_025591 [Rhipicephalus appendiculatus]